MASRVTRQILPPILLGLMAVSAEGRDVAGRFDAALADPSADQSVTYKTVGETNLLLNIFEPAGDPLPDRPSILWFHGGGWTGGFPAYLAPQAAYFAGLGYLTVTAEYRLAGNGSSNTTFDCVEDARDAFYWIVDNAASLGIDPAHIIVAGESAGGHLAACVGYIEDTRAGGIPVPQPYPAATILINPITDIAPISWAMTAAGLGDGQAALAESISPLYHLDASDPPALLLHGTADGVVSPAQSSDFAAGLQTLGRPAHLRLWEGKSHAFFLYLTQFGLTDKPIIQLSLLEIEAFLQSLELNGYPTVDGHFSSLRQFAGPEGYRSFSSLTAVGDVLYGTTYQGGASGDGALFRLNPETREHVVLHSFSGADGREPYNGLAIDGSTLYGVCKFGGDNGGGTLFSIQTDGSGFTLLHHFSIGSESGYYPHAAPVLVDGVLYGTTYHGGSTTFGGSIYRFPLPAGPHEILHSCTPATGRHPTGRLLAIGDWLYGTASDFERHPDGFHGTLYRIHRTTGEFNLLHAFNGTTEGGHPYDELIYDGSDRLFGTTFGKVGDPLSMGTVFSYSISNDTLTILHDFTAAPGTGSKPNGSLLSIDSSGFLYGVAHGSNDPSGEPGTLFQVKEDGSRFDILHRFSGSLAGNTPMRGLTWLGGALYGVTAFGGLTTDLANPETGGGLIFRYNPVSSPSAARTAFIDWLSLNGLLVNQSPDNNTDFDTLTLIEEFAYGGDPGLTDSIQPVVLSLGANLTATVPSIRQTALPAGSLMASGNLQSWNPATGYTLSDLPHPTKPGFRILSYEWPTTTLQTAPLFLSFEVDLDP
jgi:acetyl esterase